jgi:uncharacterized protein
MRSTLLFAFAAFLVAAPVHAGKKAAAKPEAAPEKKSDVAPPEFESYTLVILERGAKAASFSEAELEKLQVQHLAHLTKLGNEGKILLAGPFADQTNESMRGACIYSVPLAEAVKLAEEDPMVKAGRLKITAMTWWMEKGYVAFPKSAKPATAN